MSSLLLSNIYILGSGPVGLFLANLLVQHGFSNITVIDNRENYTRERYIKITRDLIPGENNDIYNFFNIFDIYTYDLIKRSFINTSAYNFLQDILDKQIKIKDLQEKLHERCSFYIRRVNYTFTDTKDFLKDYDKNAIVIDCMGYNTRMRNLPGFIYHELDIENVVILTFSLSNKYICNTNCKFTMNKGIINYPFLPYFDEKYDNNSKHITAITTIYDNNIAYMLRNIKDLTLDKIKLIDNVLYLDITSFLFNISTHYSDTVDENTINIISIPLRLYCSLNPVSIESNNYHIHHYFQVGDSCIGSPYFQSVTSGFESAIILTFLLTNNIKSLEDVQTRYKDFININKNKIFTRTLLLKQKKDIFNNTMIKSSSNKIDSIYLSDAFSF